jgi:hypothetical protein
MRRGETESLVGTFSPAPSSVRGIAVVKPARRG